MGVAKPGHTGAWPQQLRIVRHQFWCVQGDSNYVNCEYDANNASKIECHSIPYNVAVFYALLTSLFVNLPSVVETYSLHTYIYIYQSHESNYLHSLAWRRGRRKRAWYTLFAHVRNYSKDHTAELGAYTNRTINRFRTINGSREYHNHYLSFCS